MDKPYCGINISILIDSIDIGLAFFFTLRSTLPSFLHPFISIRQLLQLYNTRHNRSKRKYNGLFDGFTSVMIYFYTRLNSSRYNV